MKLHKLINYTIQKRGYTSYLELGVGKGRLFTKVKAKVKHGVEPSRKVRRRHNVVRITPKKFLSRPELLPYDVIVINLDNDKGRRNYIGLLFSAIRLMNENGVLFIKGVNPKTKEHQKIPRKVRKGFVGRIWEAFVVARTAISKLSYTLDTDRGLGVIDDQYRTEEKLNIAGKRLSYKNFKANKKEWLGLLPIEAHENLLS